MSQFARPRFPLGALVLGTLVATSAAAAPSASIEQIRNGPATATSTPSPSWGTGNAGASNSHYLESHSIAYRTVMDQLPTNGTVIELVIAYDVKRSGSYALDYLTHYQRLLPHVLFGHSQPEVFDPLNGVSGVGAMVTTAPVPLPSKNLMVDPDGAESSPAALQPSTNMGALTSGERAITLFGGTLIDVSYDSEADVNLATASSETRVRVRFTANSPKAVLAWGGHIACRWDWGFNADGSPRSAGGISGSSYHMRMVGWNLGSLGNQDRSMSTDAVYPVPRCGVSNVGPFCAGSTNVHTAPSGMESYSWEIADNTSGAAIVGPSTGLSVTVFAGATNGSYRLVVTTGASGFTRQCDATVAVNAPVTADAGSDQVACASSPQVQLAGVVTGGNAAWSGGGGTFAPSASVSNATYTPTAAEIAAGGVTLTLTATAASGPCAPATDAMRITIQKIATVNAGADLVACATSPQLTLAGGVGGAATSGTWSGGGGTFAPSASTLNATYMPTAAEVAAGSVTLTLITDDPAGPCGPVSDAVRLTFAPPAIADAGVDLAVCASAPQAALTGAVRGSAASGTWSGGAGTFAPSASALNATYTPTAAEIAGGGVTLTLVTNDPAGPCGAVSDQVRIAIQPAATVNAGIDQVVCATSPQVTLAGSIGGGAVNGAWSGGGGTFAPSRAALNATYVPSAAEIAAGSVTLTLVTEDPAGPCGAQSDAMSISILPAATVNAGADQRVCAGAPQAVLAGTVGGGANSGVWSGGAGTFTPSASVLNATYRPTAGEIAAGSVTLTLTTNDPAGPCGALADAMKITIDPITTANAGADAIVCASAPQVPLSGTIGGTVSSGTWSGGTGSFNPGRWALNATYTPSAAEIAGGTVTLTLVSTTPTGPCPAATDAMTITIQPAAVVNAGADQITCAVSPTVRLAASLGGAATSGTWSGGWGIFNPGVTTWNAEYTPTPSEIAGGSVTLTWTSNDPAGPCAAVSDQVKITYDAPAVTVRDRIVCTDMTPVTLSASVTQGIPPYTYRWSNGATTASISVADTGSYTVTITDAQGCQATDSGRFGWRECTGQLTHTSATCASFVDGTAEDLPSADIHWEVRDGKISTISPGVFFYWTKVTAPSSNFTIAVVQIKDNPTFPFIPVMQGQVRPFDQNCTVTDLATETTGGQAVIPVSGATPGKVYIVSVKYSLKALVGVAMPEGSGVRYDFRTEIDGRIVDADPDGLQIGEVQPPVAGSEGSGGPVAGEDPIGGNEPVMKLPNARGAQATAEREEALMTPTWRPMPNPFTSGMRMQYAVSRNFEPVRVQVLDVAGRVVRTLVNAVEAPGTHVATWDGRDESGARMREGVYFVHVRIGDAARQVRVTMLK